MARKALAGLLVIAVAGLAAAGAGSPPAAQAATPTLAQLVGQRLVVGITGTTASGWLRARVRAGQIGGVILSGPNISSPAQVKALTASLQAAAAAGGQPKLLISTDQEGGEVKRIPWAPPNRSAKQLGALPASTSQSSGLGTGQALRAIGLNVDLAPVADVPTGPSAFIEQQQRAFSTSRFTVANDAAAFGTGLESGHVWPTFKHFPGLGRATVTTDEALVTITASQATILAGTLPYQVAFRRSLHPIVMLSTAVYPAYSSQAAAWSPTIIRGLLRGKLGFQGATITDSLDAAAAVRHVSVASVALKSAQSGADMVLVTGSDATSQSVYTALLNAAKAGTLPMSQLQASYNRIQVLKNRLG